MPYTFAIALPPENEPEEVPKAIVQCFSTSIYQTLDLAANAAEALVGDVDVLAYWPVGHYQITMIDAEAKTEVEHLEIELTEAVVDDELFAAPEAEGADDEQR